jgi:hypothetical protein
MEPSAARASTGFARAKRTKRGRLRFWTGDFRQFFRRILVLFWIFVLQDRQLQKNHQPGTVTHRLGSFVLIKIKIPARASRAIFILMSTLILVLTNLKPHRSLRSLSLTG